ncbi:atypical/PDHK/BCKDK protein kinase [Marasmius fiardii PR-910]|nr:atypical/PDHK/BCKDK protein kinase [Marasmius fiardii PR-910]
MSHRLTQAFKPLNFYRPLLTSSLWCRHESTALHFYQNKQLDLYASREAKRLTLRQLVFYGRSMDEERLVKSANYVRTELPVRIAHRIRDLQSLPYVVVTQEGVAKVYELYWTAFEKFRRYPPITNFQENQQFCQFLSDILDDHATVIPNLSLGLSLSSPYLPPDDLDAFMRRMLVSRISRRVLAEHHIALSESYVGKHARSGRRDSTEHHVGIIFTALDVRKSIERCARILQEQPITGEVGQNIGPCPEVIIEGHTETKFSYIREHLEYIIFELLKNSIRATQLSNPTLSTLPPVRATIAAGSNDVGIRISDQGGGLFAIQKQYGIKSPSDLFSFSHVRNSARMEVGRIGALRSVSSRPQGVWATVGEQVQDWQDSPMRAGNIDIGKHAEIRAHPQIGIGLPMSNIFAKYFGGSLELVSVDGWGTDAYVRLPKLGTNLEGIEV